MAHINDVAAYILDRRGPMTVMKLQKLCYYAYGYHLAWEGRRLFPERFEAWANGPVAPALYRASANAPVKVTPSQSLGSVKMPPPSTVRAIPYSAITGRYGLKTSGFWVAARTATAWYGVPWWMSDQAERMITLISRWLSPCAAIQVSGTIRPPAKPSSTLTSSPRRFHAAATAASR